jgi:cellulose synthase/poly-beta-1,6-N-acetylglucosamine synthase-like glycosyltransferase
LIAPDTIISLLLIGLYVLVFIYFIVGWASLKRPTAHTGVFKTKVTILIAARNEENNIRFTIDDILAQDYPKELTEIIIVDDHSTDKTSEIISSYADRGIKLLQLKEDKPLNSYKKKAIAQAINLSTGELMVATDADCRMGKKWLSSVVGYYENNSLVMISSPVAFFEERNLFEYMQTLEFAFLIGTGAALIGNKKASTCNGANLAYRKDIFYEVGGFSGIDDLASGDDELLLQKIAKRYPGRVGFLKNRDAIVYTHSKHTLKQFLQQRRRWASKSTHYKDKRIVALAVGFWLFNLSLLVNAALGFYDIYYFKLFALQLLIKYVVEMAFLLQITAFFKRQSLCFLGILTTTVHIVYIIYIGLIGNAGKYEWKGRMVR